MVSGGGVSLCGPEAKYADQDEPQFLKALRIT